MDTKYEREVIAIEKVKNTMNSILFRYVNKLFTYMKGVL